MQAPAGRLRARAFGLDIDAGFEIPGLNAVGGPLERAITVDLASAAEVEARWPGEGAHERISNRPGLTIDSHEQAGFLMRATGWGIHWMSPGGDRMLCCPEDHAEPWSWQRYLVGQLLPFAAVLQGLEVFHASAVVLDGMAVALVGPSRAGKSTLAAHLVLRGASFLTDDVLALEASGEGLVAHPGAALASLRHSAGGLAEAAAALGRGLGEDEDAVRVELSGHPSPARLGAIVFIDREAGGPLRVEAPRTLDPRRLLGATFNFVLRSPERLTRQLDVCARASRQAELFAASVPPDASPLQVVERLEQSIRSAWRNTSS